MGEAILLGVLCALVIAMVGLKFWAMRQFHEKYWRYELHRMTPQQRKRALMTRRALWAATALLAIAVIVIDPLGR
jgi:ABC-type Fe3+ transport system permease subunit